MDLSNLQGEESGFLHLKHPSTDEYLYEGDKPVGFHTHSRFSKIWRQKTSELENARMGRKKKITAERNFHETNEVFAALITGVDNLTAPTDEGAAEKVTPRNVAKLVFANPRLAWVREQFDQYLGDDAVFFQK